MTAAAGWAATALAQGEDEITLLGAWRRHDSDWIGYLRADGHSCWPVAALRVPSRAHAVLAVADAVMAVARRPGEWLLRWWPLTGDVEWHWLEAERRFNGHALLDGEGQRLWTSETDVLTGRGRIGVRDARTLAKVTEWDCRGADPHQLLHLPRSAGPWSTDVLFVANGGVPQWLEAGRRRVQPQTIDASLVLLDARSGALLGQWRLEDPFLSIRHLAWHAPSQTLGVALQAEHPVLADRQGAAVLALWRDGRLRCVQQQPPLHGYGGDIVALPAWADAAFAVSCPRANAVALFDAQGNWVRNIEHQRAYALAAADNHWALASAEPGPMRWERPGQVSLPTVDAGALRVDNHWVLVQLSRV